MVILDQYFTLVPHTETEASEELALVFRGRKHSTPLSSLLTREEGCPCHIYFNKSCQSLGFLKHFLDRSRGRTRDIVYITSFYL